MSAMMLREALLKYRPHRGGAAQSLIDKLAAAPAGTDPWRLDLTVEEQQMLGSALADDDQTPSRADMESAVATLTAKRLRAHEKEITLRIARAEASGNTKEVAILLTLKKRVSKAIDDLEV